MKLRTPRGITYLAVCVALSLGPGAAAAQTILGKVIAADGRAPLSGAIVTLLDVEGKAVRSLLSNGEGSVTFSITTSGTYRLRAQMIGRQTLETGPFAASGKVTVRTIELAPKPIDLQGVEVNGTPVCSIDERQSLPSYQLWDEIRKALTAAQITAEQAQYRFQLVRESVTRDGRTVRTVDTLVKESSDPFVSLSPDEIERRGYERFLDVYGPNTDIFLSTGFERTHCFSLRRDGDHKGQIGLRFSVAPGREISDIEGTLWVDETSAELRSMEFVHHNLSRVFGSGRRGGEMQYVRLDGGNWIVRQWRLYAPRREENAEVTRIERIPGPTSRR